MIYLMIVICMSNVEKSFFFFFSSRRRHTRCSRDWSSDVCSSDLGKAEGSSVMRNLLGGKGCELAEMTNLGIPVPSGFTVTTQAWAHYNRADRQWPEGLWEQVQAGLERIEADAGLVLGDAKRPLLVSVRSGAR